MGYTNYLSKKHNNVPEGANEAAFEVGKRILARFKDVLADGRGEEGTEPEEHEGNIYFNGIGDESHETCMVPSKVENLDDFEFCKTALKEYDPAVVAVYATLEYFYEGAVEFSSDGDLVDVSRGLQAAAEEIAKLEFEKDLEGQPVDAIRDLPVKRTQSILEILEKNFEEQGED
jgi:hypothetical protein